MIRFIGNEQENLKYDQAIQPKKDTILSASLFQKIYILPI